MSPASVTLTTLQQRFPQAIVAQNAAHGDETVLGTEHFRGKHGVAGAARGGIRRS